MKKWFVAGMLVIAQFIMILDSTVMNVSLSTITADLNTTIGSLQSAITFYTLTMAAFMLIGGKMGDTWGRLKAFRIGSIVYGLGSLVTAISPNIAVLFIGWSIVEGLGAVLVIPAIISLISSNYQNRERAIAFASIGASSGIAAAAGPLIGGFFTTFLSWRYVFVGETLIMIILIIASRWMKTPAKTNEEIHIDKSSALLSAAGLTSLVFGILQSKTWGWIAPKVKPVIFGYEVAPLGISLVAYLILLGIILLWFFYNRQAELERNHKFPLLQVSLLHIKQLRSGLFVLLFQYFITASLFFVIPVYLQIVLGLNALDTGIKILPLSIGLVLFSILGSRMSRSFTPKRIVRVGQLFLVFGSLVLLASIDPQLKNIIFLVGMFLVGAGLGTLASQINNINVSAAGNEAASEVGGLQGTSQNLGSSLGTALIGSILIASLTIGFTTAINQNPAIPNNVKQQIVKNTQTGIPIVSSKQVETIAIENGIPQTQATAISTDYVNAQLGSLKVSLFSIAAFALLSLLFAKNLPTEKLGK